MMGLRLLGAFSLLSAGFLAFLWFVWLTPVKHIYSSEWNRNHSSYARWIEDQKSIYRIGVSHDVGIEMGYWGGKEWTTWIMKHIKPGQDITTCEASHLGNALADMTNQQLGDQSDPWLAWWKTNQNKTQLEWIRNGFAEKGVILQQPLTTNNILALLKLANPATNSAFLTNISSDLRSSVRFNAFRWLRDSGFEAKQFDLKNIPEEDRDRFAVALIDYSEWFGLHWDDPGKLQINGNDLNLGLYPVIFEIPRFRWTLYFTIVALVLGGGFLLHISRPGRRF